jgi:hypothetical protein
MSIFVVIYTVSRETGRNHKKKSKLYSRRPRRRWVDNIKMDLGEIGWNGRDWIELAPDRDQWRALMNTVMNLHVP